MEFSIAIPIHSTVIPAQAGTYAMFQLRRRPVTDMEPGTLTAIGDDLSIVWVPACAGMTAFQE